MIPSVKELQTIGVTFDLLILYLMTVNEKAVMENIDPKTAAYNIELDFREYRNLGTLQRRIEEKNPLLLMFFGS